MFRFMFTAVLLGALVLGAGAVWRDDKLRGAVMDKATALLDDVLGVKRPPPSKPKPEPRVVKAKGNLRPPGQSPPPAVVAQPTPTPAATTPPRPQYVDRAPVPTALERVTPEDRKRLDDIIAGGKASPEPAARKPVASRL
ncbi:MAG: hypothetical protein AB2A00_07400 [Myxococcota bacterium]